MQSTKTRPGADCGSDHELHIAKFRLKLKKVGKTSRPFRYDLNQILYDYTVEVRNRFKGLDLIDRVPDELWTEVYDIVQETGIKTIPMEKKCKKAKWLSGEAFQIEYTEELYKKDLLDPDNHDGVITDLEPDILECEVQWALGSITTNKARGSDGFQLSYFKSWKMML